MNKQIIRKLRNSLSLALTLGVGMTATSSTALAQQGVDQVYLNNNDRLGDAGIFQYYPLTVAGRRLSASSTPLTMPYR